MFVTYFIKQHPLSEADVVFAADDDSETSSTQTKVMAMTKTLQQHDQVLAVYQETGSLDRVAQKLGGTVVRGVTFQGVKIDNTVYHV